MKDIQLFHDNIHQGNLILVNRVHALVQNRQPVLIPLVQDNTAVTKAHNSMPANISMEINAAKILFYLMKAVDCKKEIVPVSGYRSSSEQARIYNDSLIENGAEFTKKYVALPWHSEHQTGLAVDLALNQEHIDFIRPYFPYKGICQNFRIMAPLYGFIERYPKDKEAVTGIAHEPWHFRYVGFPHSKIITEQGLTLEEYIDKLRYFPYDGKHLYFKHNNKIIEIFYLSLSETGTIRLTVNDYIFHQVSGNNVDGVIITIWRDA